VSPDPQKLTGRHRDTLRHVFAHPMSRNLEWHAVLGLLREVAPVTERPDGNVEVRGGDQVIVVRPHRKDLEPDDVVAVRHLLESLGYDGEDGDGEDGDGA
jgi:hypothetical protein